jgi:hypothetical protein
MLDLKHILTVYPAFKCMPGKCIVELERKPECDPSHPSIVLCDRSRDLQFNSVYRDVAYWGTVLAMTPRKAGVKGTPRGFEEGFKVGDRVWAMLLAEDLDKPVVLTENTRVYAVAC